VAITPPRSEEHRQRQNRRIPPVGSSRRDPSQDCRARALPSSCRRPAVALYL